MKLNKLALIAMVAISMAACGGSNNNATATDENATENVGENKAAEVTPEEATFDIFGNGKMLVNYTKPTFEINESAINPQLRNDNVKISFVSGLSPEAFNEFKEGAQTYSSSKEYSFKELEINGFKAAMVTYVEEFLGTTYSADIYVDFGDQSITNSYYGVKICVSSEKDIASCTSDDVMAVINTIKVVKPEE